MSAARSGLVDALNGESAYDVADAVTGLIDERVREILGANTPAKKTARFVRLMPRPWKNAILFELDPPLHSHRYVIVSAPGDRGAVIASTATGETAGTSPLSECIGPASIHETLQLIGYEVAE